MKVDRLAIPSSEAAHERAVNSFIVIAQPRLSGRYEKANRWKIQSFWLWNAAL